MTGSQSFGLVTKSLLDKIDRLFTCNVGEYVHLPQLVVLGDQSTGKSSVLAGLTGLPFPRDSALCTRFATQITFKRSQVTSVLISILAEDQNSNNQKERFNQQHRNENALDAVKFATVLEEAAAAMGVGEAGQGLAAFSSDVLRIEICGPQQEHFSVIDVPGLFRKTTKGVTSKEDREMVNRIVSSYMENPRSIMLTVVPANVDIATQDILERATEIDPLGLRTLGILTKPDLVDKGAEHSVIQILKGEKHPQRLGWHLLRNPEFFNHHPPWCDLDAHRVGMKALKQRLQEILADHLRQEFPRVKQEILQRLKNTNGALQALGPKRESQNEMTHFILDLATKFQSLVGFATAGQYQQIDESHESTDLRLANAIMKRSNRFAAFMEKNAHAYEFIRTEDQDKNASWGRTRIPRETLPVSEILLEPPELDVAHIMPENLCITPPSATGIMDWLNRTCIEHRGFELGTLSTQLIGVTMKIQAAKWRNIALGYISDIINLVHRFILAALKHITADTRLLENLRSLLINELCTMYQRALAHTEFLLHIELNGIPATHNSLFSETLNTHRRESADKQKDRGNGWGNIKIELLSESKGTTVQTDYAREIHDLLQAYYVISRARFVDNVRMQACDYLLVECTNTGRFLRPLELFSAKFVMSLSLKKLEEVVGEDPEVRKKRKELEKEIKQLKLGKQATEQDGYVTKAQEEDDVSTGSAHDPSGFTGWPC